MKIHAFNTGRSYTLEGQRIAWIELHRKLDEFGPWVEVAFLDLDRMIEGIIQLVGEPTDERLLSAYDAGSYIPKFIHDAKLRAALEEAAQLVMLGYPPSATEIQP